MSNKLESEYKTLLYATFHELRERHYDGILNQEDAEALHDMLEERLSLVDPRGKLGVSRAWKQSSWCGDYDPDDDGWQSSTC